MRVAKVRKTGVRVQFRKMQPDPCFSPYRRDSERALTRFAVVFLVRVFYFDLQRKIKTMATMYAMIVTSTIFRLGALQP